MSHFWFGCVKVVLVCFGLSSCREACREVHKSVVGFGGFFFVCVCVFLVLLIEQYLNFCPCPVEQKWKLDAGYELLQSVAPF